MVILLLTGLALSGAAVVFTARALALGGARRQQTFAQIEGYGFTGRVTAAEPHDRGAVRRALERLATAIGTVAARGLGEARTQDLRGVLRGAGLYRTEVETFLGYRLLAAVGLPLFLLWLTLTAGSLTLRGFALTCVVAAMGWSLPSFVLKRRGARRLQEIDLETPELVDLLVTTVEAGVGFAAALQLVSRRVEGPLAQELRLALQEQNMGLTLENALQNMLLRSDSISLRAFVQAIVQGQTLGVSIGKVLRDLAVDMRKRRRQLAEERAYKAPTKILFPLVFLILPALFIVILGGPVMGLGALLGGAV